LLVSTAAIRNSALMCSKYLKCKHTSEESTSHKFACHPPMRTVNDLCSVTACFARRSVLHRHVLENWNSTAESPSVFIQSWFRISNTETKSGEIYFNEERNFQNNLLPGALSWSRCSYVADINPLFQKQYIHTHTHTHTYIHLSLIHI